MVDIKQLKQACSDFLVYKKRSSFSYSEFINGITFILVRKDKEMQDKYSLVLDNGNRRVNKKSNNGSRDTDLIDLGLTTENFIEEMLWNLINSGIITKKFHNLRHDPSRGTLNIDDNFHITQWGLNLLSGIKPTPYDYEGYLENIKKDINSLDETIIFYLDQSLQCFNRCLYIPSTIMLGVASEQMIRLLRDSLPRKLDEEQKKKFEKDIKKCGISIYRISLEIKKRIDNLKGNMNPDLKEGLDTAFDSLWNILRISRNEAGHPTGKKIERDDAYGYFIIFRTFCKKAYNLKEWLQK